MLIQNQRAAGNLAKRWDKTGIVVECKGNDKYSVRIDGSGRITDRNRRYLRAFKPGTSTPAMPTARPTVHTPNTPASAPPEAPSLATPNETDRGAVAANPAQAPMDNPPYIPEFAPAWPERGSEPIGRDTTPAPSQPDPMGQTPTYSEAVERPARTRKLPDRFKDYDMNSVNLKPGRGLEKLSQIIRKPQGGKYGDKEILLVYIYSYTYFRHCYSKYIKMLMFSLTFLYVN